ncbi:uncharacterized protein LOC134272105 [Saccostrea cucullata]|uniref:uncharacterized protein LOC134272105 n=1 Tax=Saccostrea cuccullata TaxID=36930 RepID=UPI002ED4D9BA
MHLAVPTDYFYVSDQRFKHLHGLEAGTFEDKVGSILSSSRHGLVDEVVAMSMPKAKKRKVVHSLSFREEVQVMRQLHPDVDRVGVTEMLDPSNREWRRQAERELNFEGRFGGSFKEHISVACLSPRCYALSVEIMDLYGRWGLKQQTNCKVNRMLFAQLPGLREEDTIYKLLGAFFTKKLSKKEFNEELKNAKELQNENDLPAVRKDRKANRDHSTTATELRRNNIRLIKEKQALLLENRKLKKALTQSEENQDVNSQQEDVFAYQSDEEELYEEAEVHHQPKEREILEVPSVKYARYLGRSIQEEEEEARDRADELDDSSDSFHMEQPTFTYSRLPAQACNGKADGAKEKEASPTSATEQNLLITLEKIQGLEQKAEDEEQYFVCSVEKENEITPETEQEKETEQTECFQLGDCVLAKDGPEDEWFKAKIINTEGRMYKVHYMGYSSSYDKLVEPREVKPYIFEAGEKIRAMWEDGHFYKGKIRGRTTEGYTVQFQDGVIFTTNNVRF